MLAAGAEQESEQWRELHSLWPPLTMTNISALFTMVTNHVPVAAERARRTHTRTCSHISAIVDARDTYTGHTSMTQAVSQWTLYEPG